MKIITTPTVMSKLMRSCEANNFYIVHCLDTKCGQIHFLVSWEDFLLYESSFPTKLFLFSNCKFPRFCRRKFRQPPAVASRSENHTELVIADTRFWNIVVCDPQSVISAEKRFLKYIGIHSTLQFEESLQNCNKFCREVFMTRNFF